MTREMLTRLQQIGYGRGGAVVSSIKDSVSRWARLPADGDRVTLARDDLRVLGFAVARNSAGISPGAERDAA